MPTRLPSARRSRSVEQECGNTRTSAQQNGPVTLRAMSVALLALAVLMVGACVGDSAASGDAGGSSTETPTNGGGQADAEADAGDPGDLPARPPAGEVAEITSAHGAALRASDRRVLFVDVRSLEEYLAGHLVGAQHIPLEDDELWAHRTAALDPDHPTAVYCRTGARSSDAAQALVELGFTEVYDLGGLTAWTEGDLPLDRQPS